MQVYTVNGTTTVYKCCKKQNEWHKLCNESSCHGLKVKRLFHQLHDSTLVGLNPIGAKKIFVIIQIMQEVPTLIMFKNYTKICNLE